MVRRSRRTTLGVASLGLRSPWILRSSWTNSRFLSARSAFAFSIPASMATGQKRGRVISGGIESAGAGVSGMTASQGVFERRRSRRFDREVNARTMMEYIAGAALDEQAPQRNLMRLGTASRFAGVTPLGRICRPILLERRAFSEVLRLMGHDASPPRVTMSRLPVTRIPHCASINAEARRQGSIAMIEGVKTVGVVGAGTM